MTPRYSEVVFAEKFWEKVDKTSDASGCWLWTGSKCRIGYGRVGLRRKLHMAHRMAYLLTGHVIPEGLHLAHSEHCVGKKHCCNPAHLTPKTPIENMADKLRDGTDCRGEKSFSAKLTSQQVLEIRERANELRKDLAVEYGVTRSTISNIILKNIWKHI